MTYTIRDPLSVQFTKAPAIAIAGESGSGKTESAMRLARGYCGPGVRFLVIDTEEKRALYKKERYQPWDWMDLQPPFSPENYIGALEAGSKYPAVVLDSGSHEYISEGGLQDIAAEALERLCNGDMTKAEKLTALSWKDAKVRHKKMMNRLIRYPTLLIVCLRSEPKIKFAKEKFIGRDNKEHEKTVIVDLGFMPICEKMFMYEMLVACQLHASNAGVPEHIKKLEPDLEPVFLAGKQIDESTGERLAVWTHLRASGAKEPAATQAGVTSDPAIVSPGTAAALITSDQLAILETRLAENDIPSAKMKKAAGVESLDQIELANFDRACKWIDAQVKMKSAA